MGDDENAPEAVTVPKLEGTLKVNGIRIKKERSISSTPNRSKPNSRASSVSPETGNKGEDGAPVLENGAASKLSQHPQKAASRRNGPALFSHLTSVTEESCATFQVISDCLYGSRHMGASDHDAWDCECAEDWRKWLFSCQPLSSPSHIGSLLT
jgi:[histone H3]-lysine36 N-trimethyltransferase